jgi:multidrug resistance efflux pump
MMQEMMDAQSDQAAKPRAEDPDESLQAQEQPPRRGWAPPAHGGRRTLLFIGILLGGVFLALYAWNLPPFRRAVQSTDNAYVRGLTTTISPQVSGYVTEVLLQDFGSVTKGQPLVKVDDRAYRQRVQQARANVAVQIANLDNSQQSQRSSQATVAAQEAALGNASAQLKRAQADMRRVSELTAEGSLSERERDQTVAALRQSEAAVAQARAQRTISQEQVRTVTVGRGALEASVKSARAALRLAEIELSNTVIRAPQAGRVGEIGVRLGQFVSAGSQLLVLVPTDVWIVANFKEAQTAKMLPGQRASFTVDALGDAKLEGIVRALAPAAGSEFAVIKPENATGNFVKVPQRIAVRIDIKPGQPGADRLRPGISVVASVDTSDNAPAQATPPALSPQ